MKISLQKNIKISIVHITTIFKTHLHKNIFHTLKKSAENYTLSFLRL